MLSPDVFLLKNQAAFWSLLFGDFILYQTEYLSCMRFLFTILRKADVLLFLNRPDLSITQKVVKYIVKYIAKR